MGLKPSLAHAPFPLAERIIHHDLMEGWDVTILRQFGQSTHKLDPIHSTMTTATRDAW